MNKLKMKIKVNRFRMAAAEHDVTFSFGIDNLLWYDYSNKKLKNNKKHDSYLRPLAENILRRLER